MTIEIKSRRGTVLKPLALDTLRNADLQGANLYAADLRNADLQGANLYAADLYAANLYGANLYGANLYSANLYSANLRNADLYGANLYGANLRNADLRGANLRNADLRGANLRGADLRGADLGGANGKTQGWITQARRSDGYDFILFRMEHGELIKAGCRTFTLKEFRAHVAAEYPGTPKAEETLTILAYLAKRWKQANAPG